MKRLRQTEAEQIARKKFQIADCAQWRGVFWCGSAWSQKDFS